MGRPEEEDSTVAQKYTNALKYSLMSYTPPLHIQLTHKFQTSIQKTHFYLPRNTININIRRPTKDQWDLVEEEQYMRYIRAETGKALQSKYGYAERNWRMLELHREEGETFERK